MKQYTVAILGATGAVGTQMLECLNEQEFPVGKLKLLASARSAGKTVEFRGEQIVIEEACPEAFEGCDIVLGAAGDDIAKELLPEAVKRGAVVVDNSHAFRMDPEVPLVVPEINADDIKWHHGLIANPNCATIIGLVPTWPLHQLAGVKRMIVSTYQAASGAGAPGMAELEAQLAAVVNVQDSMNRSLLTGAVDPSTALPQYISDLKAAGLDEIKADVEKQYNEWKAAK